MEPPAGPSLGPYDYDLLVIGGGSGGLAVAKEAAGLRRKVLILDLGAPSLRGAKRVLGGSTLNVDSVRKFLQHSSLLGKALQDSENYGWKLKDHVSHSWTQLVEAVEEQRRRSSEELRRELKRCGVFYLNARGEIVAPHTVEVKKIIKKNLQGSIFHSARLTDSFIISLKHDHL
nr:thioredoxin reductase 1, cytoplasmic-like [Labrus bergylta]